MQQKILLVDEDPKYANFLSSFLENHKYDVIIATDGEAGYSTFVNGKFDLCILNVSLPKKDGFTLGKEIKKVKLETPLIFITSIIPIVQIIDNFQLTENDYISKPFSCNELLHRVQTILRKGINANEEIFLIGKYRFIYHHRQLIYTRNREEKQENLSHKEAQLLRLLCIYKNRVLPHTLARTKIWEEDNYFTARSMAVFVTKLRKYLENDKDIDIVNIYRYGYCLTDHSEITLLNDHFEFILCAVSG